MFKLVNDFSRYSKLQRRSYSRHRGLLMGKIPFHGHKNKLRLQKWCKFTESSGSSGPKIRILKIHDELASLAHYQQAPESTKRGGKIVRYGGGIKHACIKNT